MCLGDKAHDTDAEVRAAVEIMSAYRMDIGVAVSNCAVDNAAKTVAERALEEYCRLHPHDPKPLRTRDPAHCLDLVSKDLGKLSCLKDFFPMLVT